MGGSVGLTHHLTISTASFGIVRFQLVHSSLVRLPTRVFSNLSAALHKAVRNCQGPHAHTCGDHLIAIPKLYLR